MKILLSKKKKILLSNFSCDISDNLHRKIRLLLSSPFNKFLYSHMPFCPLINIFYFRTLNQRVPTYLGESRFALKHLLLSQRHSTGQEQKIPIYASKSLMRQVIYLLMTFYSHLQLNPFVILATFLIKKL